MTFSTRAASAGALAATRLFLVVCFESVWMSANISSVSIVSKSLRWERARQRVYCACVSTFVSVSVREI